jgi:hypothetical protein
MSNEKKRDERMSAWAFFAEAWQILDLIAAIMGH